jgi:hypothetical protein
VASLVRICVFIVFSISSLSLASDYGTTGLIDLPSARMEDDATIKIGAAFDERHRSYMLTYQATPWLEATFRYTGFEQFFFWDRNYEVKFRLLEETADLPQLALGIRDIVGTGVFGSEYLVASKRFGALDTTLGVGWGRLADEGVFSNPLTNLSDRFAQREIDAEFGGELATGSFFSGPNMGIFGGLEYDFERWPVTLVAEYNPDQYLINQVNGELPPASPWSFGAKWEWVPGVVISLSHQHGEELGLSISAATNTSSTPPRYRQQGFVSATDMQSSDLPPQIRQSNWYDKLLFDMERSGLFLVSARLHPESSSAELIIGNNSYAFWADALAHATALADLHLPATVRSIYFVIEDGGHRPLTVRVARPSTSYSQDPSDLANRQLILPGRNIDTPMGATDFVTGKINFTLELANRVQLFDPDDPLRYQFYIDVGANYALNNYTSIEAHYSLDIDNNFDESRRIESDSLIEPVRTNIVKYLVEGASGLDSLFVQTRNSLSSDIHYRLFGGVLEEMYSGVGGEVLYQPFESRLAFGLSVNHVKQRDFDKSFKHLDYETTTGFVSAYWATPFYNFDLALHTGRYLAKDFGSTFEVRRTFPNGWQIGVWATFTDVSAEQFGEGSFDKGFFFRVPINGFAGRNSRASYATRVRPIQRDGGQRLENHSGNLWWDLRDARHDVFLNAGERAVP